MSRAKVGAAETLRLDGRVAIVTGGGRGLGRAHALALAARGAQVVVNDVGGGLDGSPADVDPAADVVAEITVAGGEAVACHDTVATPAGGESIVDAALAAFGRVDIVVNNAGILRDQAFHKLTPDAFEAVLAVHLAGAVNVTRPAWVHLREQGGGRVINTTSNAGLLGNFGQASYSIAKMGLVGLTRTLSIEGERFGIKVNAIAPIARTRMTEAVLGDLADIVDPGFAAALVVLLAHDECPVTGEVFTVGAGRVARFFVGMTNGWNAGTDGATPELMLEGMGAALDERGYQVLGCAMEELEFLRAFTSA